MWKTDKFTIYISNGVYSFSIPFTACYYDDAQQEAEMDVAVLQLLDTLNLDGKSDYEKIKGVYDYICSNVNYDDTNLNNDAYKLKFTAYAALVNKTAVCQGYAVLLYRLMLELGIDCRVITGIGKTNNGNGPHAWNIIQLDNGTYYNADSTWDAGRTNYGYFLKGSGFDTDHERGDTYLTDEFCADYPTAIADYDPSTAVPQGNCGENLLWKVQDGALIIYAAGTGTPGAMTNYSDASPAPWAEFADQITDIRMWAGTDIGTNAFVGLSEVRHVALPQSLTDITPGAFADCINLVDFNFYSAVQYFTDGPVILKTTASDGIQVVTVAPSVTGSFEVPNFGMILPGALLGCENISSIYFRDNFKYLPDGTLDGCAEDLSLTFAGAVPPQIEGNAFAGHNVTISCPVNWVWSQAAKGGNYGGTAIWPEGLADLNVTMSLMNGDEVLGDTLDLDMSDSSLLTLTAQFQPASAQEAVTWSSSNTKVAAVDKKTGEVTLLKPGTAKITAAATDGSGVTASVTLNIVYVTAAKTLTARLNEDLPVIGLQPGQTRTLTVYGGENAIPAEKLSFVSSNSEIASVDENGRITAGTKPGTATITVRPKDDPLNRKVTVKVTVITMQAQSLTLAVDNEQKTELELSMSAESHDYVLTDSAADYQGNSFTPKVTWTSTDTSVAKVTTAKDGTVTLTIPKNANGECVITAVSNDLNKIQSQLKISVRDYSPRLGNSKLTLNSYSTEGAVLDLRESYGNTIEKVELVGAPKEFTLIDNTLYAKQAPNRTYNLQLKVTCEKGIYSKSLQVKVANTLPSVSVKQTEKINLFYKTSTANLTVTAPGQIITGVALTDTDDFYVDEYSDGLVTLHYAKSPATTKLDTKATLEISLEGYNTPVTKAVTISTTTAAPKLTLSSASSTINTALSEDHAVTIQVQDNTNGGTLILDDTNTEVSANFADTSFVGGSLNLTLHEGSKGGTAVISVQDSSWVKPITLKHKVTVSTKLPTLVLSKKALTLNSIFTEQTDEMSVSLSQGNLALDDLTLTCTAKESEKLNVYYAGGSIHAEIINKDNAPKQGTYSYTCTWTAPDGRTVRTTLKVVVASTVPKVKLSASTVKLNRSLSEKESIQIRPVITGGAGYTLVGFEGADDWLNFEDGVLQVKLTEKPDNGKYTFKVKPVFKHDATTQEVTLPTVLTLTVQVYDAVPKVTLSAKGKLDTLNPNSAIVYTPKLTNCAGAVTDVKLDEAYSQDFKADMENGTVKLTLKDGVKYATNITYKVRFNLTVCGETIQSPVMNVKVTQSSVKYTLSPSALTLYQSQSAPLTVKLTPSVGEISQVTVNTKSSKELIAALGQDGFTFEGGKTANLSMAFENKSILKAGKSYTLYLDVTPKNNALNAKPAQVKLSVKVMK